MYFEELSEREIFIENMLVDSIEQQREYTEMQAMYESNELEV